MKKLLLLATLFLFTTLPSWAVTPVPNTEGVSFSFRINGYGNGIMTVYDETGSPWEGHTTYSTLSESDVGTAQLQPGKRYAVNFQSSGVGEYWLSFIVPTGYRLHISDDSPGFTTSTTRNIYYKNVGGGWQSTDLRIELRPVASAGQTSIGGFSGIQIGRSIAWSVGVGGLRTGRSAGKIAFRQPDLTGTPASRANLYWFTPPDSSQLSANYDGPSDQTLRQILGAQAIIDLKDEAGGGYSIKFYRWHLATYNAVTELWEPAYSAWKTILVESPAANQLKISETEGSVTRVSFLKLINGTVSSGDYEWQLQEGDGTNWLRTTTHDSTSTGNNIVATGGTVSTSGSGSYKIHTFTSAGTLNVTATPSGQTIETLIVAGGGGGGGGAGVNGGGGAGGGGVRTTTITPTVSAYSFTVGVGGSAGTSGGGGNGGNSTAFALSAIGGGEEEAFRDTALQLDQAAAAGVTPAPIWEVEPAPLVKVTTAEEPEAHLGVRLVAEVARAQSVSTEAPTAPTGPRPMETEVMASPMLLAGLANGMAAAVLALGKPGAVNRSVVWEEAATPPARASSEPMALMRLVAVAREVNLPTAVPEDPAS